MEVTMCALRFNSAGDQSLQMLREGNQRFAQGTSRYGHEDAVRREQLIHGQHPFATVLSCSDSRVPPELLFDQGLGDLFVVRAAGHVIDANAIASIVYSVCHLRTPLVVVLGHSQCGAVTAALEDTTQRQQQPESIQPLLAGLQPALRDVDRALPHAQQVTTGVLANVQWSLEQLVAVPELAEAHRARTFELAGGVYDLETGEVHFLPDALRYTA
jgi:carbonic anhydrase